MSDWPTIDATFERLSAALADNDPATFRKLFEQIPNPEIVVAAPGVVALMKEEIRRNGVSRSGADSGA